MINLNKVYLKELLNNEEFKNLITYIETLRPEIPMHIPEPDNTELWKQYSARQYGFDHCFTQFTDLLTGD